MAKLAKKSEIIEIGIKETVPRTFVHFLQTAHAIEKYSDIELYKIGLSIPKLMVLQILDAYGGTMMPSKIASRMLRSNHNLTTLIDRLNRDGLVRVERGIFADRREVHVILTDKGQKALKKSRPVNRKIIKKIMADMDENAAASLEQQLKHLRFRAVEGLDQNSAI